MCRAGRPRLFVRFKHNQLLILLVLTFDDVIVEMYFVLLHTSHSVIEDAYCIHEYITRDCFILVVSLWHVVLKFV